jgi:hypothetical protein
MRRSALAAVVLGALVLVSTALAVIDGTYRGRSSQGFRVSALSTDTQVQRVNIPWKATDCTPDDGYSIKAKRFVWANDERGAIEQKGSRFSDRGRVTLKTKTGKAFVSAKMTGKMTDHDSLAGTQRVSVRTDEEAGTHRCTASMKWKAKLVRPRSGG